MANNTIKRVWNANKLVSIEDLSGMTFQGENGGHTFEVSGVDDSGSAVSISGTVTAVFLRSDNAAISISGSVSSGKAVATLTQNCYTVPGRFLFTIFVAANSQKVAIYSATGNVARTDGVATGSVPPLVTDSIQTGTITTSGDVTVGGAFDVVTRRCRATLSSVGWYRAVSMPPSYGTVSLNIERVYDANPPEVHNIDAVITYSGGVKCDFVNEVSKSTSLLIDKVRLSVASGFYYLDIHYTGTSANDVVLTFEASLTSGYGTTATQMGLAAVADAPSGETILTPYEFAANTEQSSSGTSDGVQYKIKRTGKIVSLTIESSGGKSCTQGQYTTVYALPSWAIPWATVYTAVDTYGSDNVICGMITASGDVQIYPVNSSTAYYRFTITYQALK